jgi:hypothetical protein
LGNLVAEKKESASTLARHRLKKLKSLGKRGDGVGVVEGVGCCLGSIEA